MNTFMIVATFKEGVTQEEIRALIPAEQVQAKALVEQGVLGFPVLLPIQSCKHLYELLYAGSHWWRREKNFDIPDGKKWERLNSR